MACGEMVITLNKNYAIITDSTTDLPTKYLEDNNVRFISLSFTVSENTYKDDLGKTMSHKDFYSKMRAGDVSITAQINVSEYTDFFKPILDEGKDIIYIGFSSALSGSYNSSCIAASELKDKYPDRKIVCIDSKCASLGEGLFLNYAISLRDSGIDFDELILELENSKQTFCHWFTVDDLNHLHRGGRVSKASAVVGTLLGIKPILNVDEQGNLILREKIRGRKQALLKIVEKVEKYAVNIKDQTIFISHGDCIEDVEFISEEINKTLKPKSIFVNYIGPVIGAHSGPGTVAVFFRGANRNL